MRLEGKIAVITGASRGMGEAEARLFAAEGARVIVADVLDAEGKAVAADIGSAAHYVHLDVTDEFDWQALLAETVQTFEHPMCSSTTPGSCESRRSSSSARRRCAKCSTSTSSAPSSA